LHGLWRGYGIEEVNKEGSKIDAGTEDQPEISPGQAGTETGSVSRSNRRLPRVVRRAHDGEAKGADEMQDGCQRPLPSSASCDITGALRLRFSLRRRLLLLFYRALCTPTNLSTPPELLLVMWTAVCSVGPRVLALGLEVCAMCELQGYPTGLQGSRAPGLQGSRAPGLASAGFQLHTSTLFGLAPSVSYRYGQTSLLTT